MSLMRTDILMVTYRKDYDFAWYALRAAKKFATGFGDVLVVVPMEDVGLFRPMVEQLGFRVGGFIERAGKGMLHHEAIIMEADRWCPSADAILHLDADCLFWEPTTPADFFVDGKPILYRERFDRVVNKLRMNWQVAVVGATGFMPVYDFMVRHPAVHLSGTHGLARQIISEHTGMDWKEYILSCRNEFPQTFAEFPTLGEVAQRHALYLYHFVDFSVDTPDGGYAYEHGRDKLKAFWTHGGVAPVRAELEAIIA